MGDRGNIVVSEGDGDTLYLYTHWAGSDLPGIVARGLDRGRNRWGDDPYLTRILFSQMLMEGNALEEETGYGISSRMGDGGTEVYVRYDPQIVTYDGDEFSFDAFVDRYKGEDA